MTQLLTCTKAGGFQQNRPQSATVPQAKKTAQNTARCPLMTHLQEYNCSAGDKDRPLSIDDKSACPEARERFSGSYGSDSCCADTLIYGLRPLMVSATECKKVRSNI